MLGCPNLYPGLVTLQPFFLNFFLPISPSFSSRTPVMSTLPLDGVPQVPVGFLLSFLLFWLLWLDNFNWSSSSLIHSLLCQVCCCSFLLNYSAPEFLFGSSLMFLFLCWNFHFVYMLLFDLLNCLPCCLVVLAHLYRNYLNSLLDNFSLSNSLVPLTGRLLYFFGKVLFLWFIMIPVALCR